MIHLNEIPGWRVIRNLPESVKQEFLEELLSREGMGVHYTMSGNVIIIVNRESEYITVIEAEVKKYKYFKPGEVER